MYGVFGENTGRETTGRKALLPAMLAAVFFCLWTVSALAWHVPDVEITAPSDGDSLSGVVSVSADYSVSPGNVHSVQLLVDGDVVFSVAVHQSAGSYTFSWNSATVDDGPHVLAVRAYTAAPPSDHFNEVFINITTSNIACSDDLDCDDADDLTLDVCQNPGTPSAVCVNTPIACNDDADCDDSDDLTIDTCTNPGTTAAACVNTAIACNDNSDCNDSDPGTIDECVDGGTVSAVCVNTPIECVTQADCDDSNHLTKDICINGGTASAECLYTPIECVTGVDCDDGNDYTVDTCETGVDPAPSCMHSPIACLTDMDCDDGNVLTADTCQNAGTTAAACNNEIICDPVCVSDADCDDGNDNTNDTCGAPGTCDAACSNDPICEPACSIDSNCDDGDESTADTCQSPGTCEAECSNEIICTPACSSDTDCDDADENTTDTCESPGTCDAVCAHEPVEEPVEPEEPEDQDTTPPAIGDATYDDGQILIAIEDEPGGSGLDESSIVVLVDGDAATGDYDAASRLYRIVTGLIPGAHVLTVTAADLAGNTAQEIISLEVAAGAVQVRILEVPGAPVGPDGGAPPQSSWGDFLPAPDEPDWSADGFTELIKKWKSNWPQWPQQWPDTGEQAPPVWAGVQPPCDEVSGEISDDQPAAPEGYSTDGDIVAEVLAIESEVDEDSIAVEVNGKRVGHSFDKQTGRVKAKSGKLPKGNHTVEVTAADTTGTEGMALMSFGTGATVTSIQLENLSTGGGSIGLGDQFRITVELDQADLTDAWAVLMNPDNPSADEGEHYIGWPYPLTSTGPGSFTYTFDGYFYTSFDFGELDATRIVAAAPMNDPPTSYMYSNDLTVENPPVRPQFENLQFDNVTNPGPRAISIGDDYFVSANGTPGVQGGMYLVLNLDTLTGGVGTPADALVQGGNMAETPGYGNGYYEIDGGGSANLATLEDAQSQTSRVLLSMVCAPAAGGACSYGPLLYVDNEPNMYSVTLENLSAPGEPFTSTGQQFRLSVQAPGLDPVHEPYLMGMVLNADRVPDFFPTTEDSPNLTDPFLQLTYESGDTYAVTGTLNTFTDGDGFDAESVVGVVTVTSYFDIAGISDPISVEQAPEVEIYRINITNFTYPERRSIDIGEEFEITAEAEPGVTGMACSSERIRFSGTGLDDSTLIAMTEGPDGHYSCTGIVTSRLDIDDLPADLLLGKVMAVGGNVATAELSEDFLTFRNDIVEVHISNTTRSGASDIAPGETFQITAAAATGHSEINGGLIDIPVFTSPLPGGPFVQITDPLTEDPPGSGQYSVEAVFLNPLEGVDDLRGFAGNPASDDPLTLTLSTEKLDVLDETPLPPTTIDRVAGQDVVGGEVTAAEFAPIIEGAAPADSTVNIYELISGGSIGDMVPLGSSLLSATYNAGADGYDISAPAMSLNGQGYDLFGENGMIIDPCSGESQILPLSDFTCISGDKDINAYLVTLENVINKDTGELLAERGFITLYTAGGPDNSDSDQSDIVNDFIGYKKDLGEISGYNIDAFGTVFTAQGQGQDYIPADPISAKMLVCNEEAQPGYLQWDDSAQQYLASYTPLSFNNVEHSDIVIWGLEDDGDAPNVIGGPDAPIWWADGGEDVYAVLIYADSEGWGATFYATAGYSSMLPGDLTIVASAVALTAPTDPTHTTPDPDDDHYTWNQTALDAAGIGIVGTPVCDGYGRTLIAQTTAAAGDIYATQTIPFAAAGNHLVYAQSLDSATGDPFGQSSIVTYHLESAQDTEAPVISNFIIENEYISPTNPTSIGIADSTRITADITDESDFDWWLNIYDTGGVLKSFPSGHNTGADLIWDGTDDAAQTVSTGAYEAILTAIDDTPQNNMAEATIAIFVDDESPIVSILSPVDGYVHSGIEPILVTAEISDNYGVTDAQLWINGQHETQTDCMSLGGAPEQFACEWNVENLPKDTYSVEMRGIDVAGNQGSETISVKVKKTHAPEVEIYSILPQPILERYISGDFKVLVRFKYQQRKINEVRICVIDGQCYTHVYDPAIKANNWKEVEISVPASEFEDGEIQIQAEAQSVNGRVGHSDKMDLFVDNNPIEIVSTDPEHQSIVSSVDSITIEIDDSTGSGLDTNSLSMIINGEEATDLDFTPATGTAGVLTYQESLQPGPYSVSITMYDFASNPTRATVTFRIADGPINLTAVPLVYANKIILLDSATTTVAEEIEDIINPGGVAPAKDYVTFYSAQTGDDSVAIKDLFGEAATPSLVGDMPSDIVVSPDMKTAYAVNQLGDSISIINLEDLSATPTTGMICRAPSDIDINASGTHLIIACPGDNSLLIYNLMDNTRAEAVLPGGTHPKGVVFSFDGTTAYTAAAGTGNILAINTASGTVTATYPSNRMPHDIALHPAADKIYIAARGANTISVLHLDDGQIHADIPVPAEPEKLYISTDGAALYAVSAATGNVTVIDTETGEINEIVFEE